jgi:hypothetical protein
MKSKKRKLSAIMFCLAIIAFTLVFPNITIAQLYTYGDFMYTVSGGTVTIAAYTGVSGVVVIPTVIEGMPVVGIGDRAFSWMSNLTKVTIPDSITSIGAEVFLGSRNLTSIVVDSNNPSYSSQGGALYDKPMTQLIQYPGGKSGGFIIPDTVTNIKDYAFAYCTGLTSVSIPDSVTSIRNGTFVYCSGLTNVTIGNGVTSIGKDAFYYCDGLISVTIPNSVTSIGEQAFYYCSGLTKVTIPNSVTSIGDNSFNGCYGLTSVTIGNGITTIGLGVFSGCSGLTSVTIPSSVTSIGVAAFNCCIGLTSVTIPNSVTDIEDTAFSYCTSLTSVIIPNSVTSIEASVFEGCSGLTSVIIPNSITSIGNYAFAQCTSLTSVTIPSSVTSIGGCAFLQCSGLISIVVDVNNIVYSSQDGVIYDKRMTQLIQYPGGKSGGFIIPDSVTSICGSAFAYCSGLTSVTISDSVTNIGGYAFASCSTLTSVTIPSSVTSIGGWAFSDCTGLTRAYFDGNAPAMGRVVFGGCASNFTVCYRIGREGFSTPTWNGYPAGVCTDNQCATEAIYGEQSEQTELLRAYRDSVLGKTPEGQEIIKTYYKFSPTITNLLEQGPLLKNRAKAFIDSMLPSIREKVEESNEKR